MYNKQIKSLLHLIYNDWLNAYRWSEIRRNTMLEFPDNIYAVVANPSMDKITRTLTTVSVKRFISESTLEVVDQYNIKSLIDYRELIIADSKDFDPEAYLDPEFAYLSMVLEGGYVIRPRYKEGALDFFVIKTTPAKELNKPVETASIGRITLEQCLQEPYKSTILTKETSVKLSEHGNVYSRPVLRMSLETYVAVVQRIIVLRATYNVAIQNIWSAPGVQAFLNQEVEW